jgi:acetoin utilization deacetylase AcuC-like enzyme
MIANMHPVRNAATYPTHIVGRLGWHTVDTSCPIGPGTGPVCAATDVATAAQLVLDGEDATCTLPSSGSSRLSRLGQGFCFNNSAVAAAHLRQGMSVWRSSTLMSIMVTVRKAFSRTA